MTEYVIHADDFGHDDSVNDCIDKCFQYGWIGETSLMVNMPGCEKAICLATQNGYLHRVGIHLNLTEGVPLTDQIRECRRICDEDGKFNMVFHLSAKGRFVFSSSEKQAVSIEVEAQLKKFRDIQGAYLRLDSHHHVHTDWSVYQMVVPIALRYGIREMRISADLHKCGRAKSLYKILLNRNIRKRFLTTDHFDGITSAMLSDPGGVTEVMVHPLLCNGQLCDTNKPFEDQIKALKSAQNSFIRGWNHV